MILGSTVVDIDPIRRRREKLVLVHRGVRTRNDRPRVRVGRRFAGEVSGVKLIKSGVAVVEVQRDASHNPLISVDFDDTQKFDAECIRPIVARNTRTTRAPSELRGSR